MEAEPAESVRGRRPAAPVDKRDACRQRRVVAAVALPVAAAAAIAAVTLLGPSHTDPVVRALPATEAPTPVAASARPTVDRPIPAAALPSLQSAVHQLTESVPGRPAALRARVDDYRVDSWRSPNDFTLLVSLDLHFRSNDAMAWNEGQNDRFVTFTRKSSTQPYRLEWASSP